jgi:hypothetical protein
MYAERIIQLVLDSFEKKNGWRPVFHSVEQIDELNAYIDSITEPDANSVNTYWNWRAGKKPNDRRLEWIRRQVRNEQFCCFVSAEYFATRYGRIRGVDERIMRIQFRKAQVIFHRILARYDDLQIAIQLFFLKARQVGISTVVAMYFLHRILFRSNTHAIMASAQVPQSEKLAMMIETTWSRLPFWLAPAKTSTKEKEPRWANGSALSVQAGSQNVGIAQGSTPTCIHLCLHPDTQLHLQNGTIRRICEVRAGDSAITSLGRTVPILKSAISPRPAEAACELWLWGNYSPLVVSRDHPILTPDGFIAAENLGKGDYVSIPVRPLTEEVSSITLHHNPTGWHGHSNTRASREQTVKLDTAWGWLCGLYLSEGSLHRNSRLAGNPPDSVYFTIHQKEREKVESGLRIALAPLGIKNIHFYQSKNTKTAHLSVKNSGLARWFEACFGSGAENKTIPDWCFAAGYKFAWGLTKGYFEGDGHISPRVLEVCCHSVSQSLIFQMRDLLASMGIGWSSIYHREAGFHYGRNCKPIWTLAVNGAAATHFRAAMKWPQSSRVTVAKYAADRALKWDQSPDGKFIWIKVFDNRPTYCNQFYDLEVDAPEHDFCTIHCCVKNSEIADYTTPKKTIEEGLFPAAHQTASLFFVLEGTGSTASPWQKEKWEYYKEHRNKGGRFCPIFIPPSCADDIYPHPDWLRGNPIPESWTPCVDTLRMKRRAELFIRSTDYLAEEMGTNWEMGREYQWFWECGYKEAVASHSEKTFLAMNAVTDDDAFQSKFDSVFSDETIDVVTKGREQGYKAYAITGPTIIMGSENEPYRPPEETIDYSEPRIQLHWEANDGNKYDWELVPLKFFDDSEDGNCFDKLLVFEEPRDGMEYVEAVDTADGLGMPNEDRSYISVHRVQHGRERDVQVAAFSSLRMNAAQSGRLAAAIAVLYTTDGDGTITSSNPMGMKFIIEQTRKAGDDCQLALKIMGFYDHHVMIRYDDKGNIVETKGHKEGWYTSKWSRPFLLTKFVAAVTSGFFKPNCPILIRQLATFVRKEKSGISEMTHEVGQHDDAIFGAAQGWITAHHLDGESERLQLKYQPKGMNQPAPDDRWATNAIQLL